MRPSHYAMTNLKLKPESSAITFNMKNKAPYLTSAVYLSVKWMSIVRRWRYESLKYASIAANIILIIKFSLMNEREMKWQMKWNIILTIVMKVLLT